LAVSRSEIRLQLEDVVRQATAMLATLEAGELPFLSDARVLRMQTVCAERLIELAHVVKLRETPERTPEEDKASQVEMARRQNARADERESPVMAKAKRAEVA
jgi:hypothetical protein